MRVSIKYKVLIGYSIITLVGLLLFNSIIENRINKNNKKIIWRDMKEVRRNINIYTKQYFLLDNIKINEINFKLKSQGLGTYLSSNMEKKIWLYSLKGDALREEFDILTNLELKKGSIDLVLDNKTGYEINYYNHKVLVDFAYSIKIGEKKLGIVRYIADYSELFDSSKKLLNIIRISSFCIFLFILLFSILLSRRITTPIIKFSNYTKAIEDGKYNEALKINSNDEIGDLSQNLMNMSQKIKHQIDIIKQDRDALKELNEHRKIFLDNVTHELKTPLTTILGYAREVKAFGEKDREIFKEGMENISSESERLHKMVVDLLELSSQSKVEIEEEFEKVNISSVLNDTCGDMSFKAERYGCKICTHIEENIMVEGIKHNFKEVFINIIDNAIKYGYVNSIIKVNAETEGKCVKIIVENSGYGISEHKLEKIFEPFYRGDKKSSRERGSNGLGLAIVKAIVDKHKGEIFIDSKENISTKVVIKFSFNVPY